MQNEPPLGLSHGSFSTFHISASASDMRRWNRCSRAGAGPFSVSAIAASSSWSPGRSGAPAAEHRLPEQLELDGHLGDERVEVLHRVAAGDGADVDGLVARLQPDVQRRRGR